VKNGNKLARLNFYSVKTLAGEGQLQFTRLNKISLDFNFSKEKLFNWVNPHHRIQSVAF